MMTKLGATVIIDGGATMNPSVEEFVAAVHQVAAEVRPAALSRIMASRMLWRAPL